ncbi:MAG: DUF5591 domain-containing protein [Candidatus Thermoplasmatota archaeon]|nr:DUF5591 domain-containing protein [Candidatus Thermoplasmatota archaeon]
MQFKIINRDGPSRTGILSIKENNIKTPNIFFLHSSKLKIPDFADILITSQENDIYKPSLKIVDALFSDFKKPKDELIFYNRIFYPKDSLKELLLIDVEDQKSINSSICVIPVNSEIVDETVKKNPATIYIVANALQLYNQQSQFVDFLVKLRQSIGFEKIIFLPAIGKPENFALFAYMGVDFFDSISALTAARKKMMLFSTGEYLNDALAENPCNCAVCESCKDNPSNMSYEQILKHNYNAINSEIKNVRNAITCERLRELVEIRIRSNPQLTAILKIFENNFYSFLEKRTPIVRKNTLVATSNESLKRPEVVRFQKRLLSRYAKPPSAKILLLLPCSAKKPYSFSKSHKLFRKQFDGLSNPDVLHEIIITSPIGVVPRELELTYPASVYDISVTGIWSEDEKKMISQLLRGYLKINDYKDVILHLPSSIVDFLSPIVPDAIVTTVDSSSTSSYSLERLHEVLKERTNQYEKVSPDIRKRENVLSLASYQFGKETAKQLLKDTRIIGRYPYLKIFHKSTQLGMVTQERGLISLTIEGAEILAHNERYWVDIYDDFTLKGSVFAPGVKDADEKIRVGDEVIIRKNKSLCGVGVAQMTGSEMIELKYGEAVKMRHRL